jgi:hypothetical protein
VGVDRGGLDVLPVGPGPVTAVVGEGGELRVELSDPGQPPVGGFAQ